MNRGKPSKRKKQPVKRTGCKPAGPSGGRGAQGLPSRGFMRCVGAAVSGRSLQPKAQHAHEQGKTKQTQNAAGQENRLQTGRNKRREGSARRSFPPVLMRCVDAAVSGRSLQPKARRAHEQRKTKQMKKQPVKRTGCKQAGTSGGRGAKGVPSRRFSIRCGSGCGALPLGRGKASVPLVG